ncbi:hypothetical protein DFH09DRAFT_1369181 [Mycena vulgaris]|nr:hypothetical protein DFH09DRAFT_1369181 [Mycena vulgaris]
MKLLTRATHLGPCRATLVETKPTEVGKPPAHWPSCGELIVEKLSAGYSPDGPKVLRDISFRINSGERVGIVGRTGSGQSSLTLALLRYIYTEGTVHYDGIPAASLNLDALLSNITIIPQMVRQQFLFDSESDVNLVPPFNRAPLIRRTRAETSTVTAPRTEKRDYLEGSFDFTFQIPDTKAPTSRGFFNAASEVFLRALNASSGKKAPWRTRNSAQAQAVWKPPHRVASCATLEAPHPRRARCTGIEAYARALRANRRAVVSTRRRRVSKANSAQTPMSGVALRIAAQDSEAPHRARYTGSARVLAEREGVGDELGADSDARRCAVPPPHPRKSIRSERARVPLRCRGGAGGRRCVRPGGAHHGNHRPELQSGVHAQLCVIEEARREGARLGSVREEAGASVCRTQASAGEADFGSARLACTCTIGS